MYIISGNLVLSGDNPVMNGEFPDVSLLLTKASSEELSMEMLTLSVALAFDRLTLSDGLFLALRKKYSGSKQYECATKQARPL